MPPQVDSPLNELVYTPSDEIPKIRETLRQTFRSGKLKPISYRKEQLLQLAYMIKDNSERLQEALMADLGRPALEAQWFEITDVANQALIAYKNVDKWSKTERAAFSLNFAAMKPAIRKEPKGVVLIIGPFNYPISMTLGPLANAIAAGNAVVVKPSEMTPASSTLITELMLRYLDKDLFRVVNGGVEETTKLLDLQWDHILYTGSGRVGRIIATAAAKHLTPCTLELGGKSPVVIDPKSDLMLAARRILWGRMTNAGQVCIAPDYILVPIEGQDALVDAFKKVYSEFYPYGARWSTSFARIVNDTHVNRLKAMLQTTKGTVVCGGADEVEEDEKYIPPTILRDVQGDDSTMKEEIFGPILPIVPVESLDKAIEFINERDHPLALYVFSSDSAFKAKVFDNTQSGSAIANDVVIHAGIKELPFGGVGASGYGAHMGKFAFDTFSHHRATLDSPGWLDLILSSRYPPYTDQKYKLLGMFQDPWLPSRSRPCPPLLDEEFFEKHPSNIAIAGTNVHIS